MATCKDCLHYDVCVIIENSVSGDENYLTEFGCEDFKDRTKWVEQKHGRWVKNHQDDNIVYCDQCYMPQDLPTPFCHSCGAKMDL